MRQHVLSEGETFDLGTLPRPPYEKEECSVYGWDAVRSARSSDLPTIIARQRRQMGEAASKSHIETAAAASLALQGRTTSATAP